MTEIPLRTARIDTGDPKPLLRLANLAEAAICVIGILMLLELVRYLIAGNTAAIDPRDPASGNPLARASWYPFYLAFTVMMVARAGRMFQTAIPALLIYALLAFSVLSIAWSVAPDISLRRNIATAFTALFGIYLAVRAPPVASLQLFGIAIGIVMVCNFLVIAALPSIGIDHDLHAGAWKGMMNEKNALGGDMSRCAVIFMALAHLDKPRRLIWLGALMLAGLQVLGSTSTTALVTFAFATGAAGAIFIARTSAVATILMVWFGVLIVSIGAIVFMLFPAETLALFGKDATLTGRTDIWSACVNAILQRPVTGYGLGAFWIEPLGPSYYVREVLDWEVPSAHNNWLEMGLGLGLPGIFLMGLLVVAGLARGFVKAFWQGNPWALIALAQLLIFSLSESVIYWSQNTYASAVFIFWSAIALMPSETAAGRQAA